MDRCKNMCFHIIPIYYGDRPVTSRGKPNESKDYYFQCYESAENAPYRTANSIKELCNGCKKYYYIKPLAKEEIKEIFYKGKSREVQVVSSNGWHFETR